MAKGTLTSEFYNGFNLITEWEAIEVTSTKVQMTLNCYLEVPYEATVKLTTGAITPIIGAVYKDLNTGNLSYGKDWGTRNGGYQYFSFLDSYFDQDLWTDSSTTQPKSVTLSKGKYFIASSDSEYLSVNSNSGENNIFNAFEFVNDYAPFSLRIEKSDYYKVTIAKGTTFGENPIDLRSTVTCNTTYFGDTAIIGVTRASNSYVNTITYEIAGTELSGTIAENSTAAKIYWQVPGDFVNSLPAGVAQTNCTLTCTTIYPSSGLILGTVTYSFLLLVDPNTSGPIFNPVIKDSNATTIALTGDELVLVKYHSNAYVESNAQGQNGASITSQSISNGGTTLNAGSGTFNNVSNNVFIFKAVDNRGFSSSKTVQYGGFIDYIKLTLNFLTPAPDGTGKTTITISGNYFGKSFGAVENTLTVQYRYSTTEGQGNWITVTPAIDEVSYGIDIDLEGLDYTQAYYFEARASDKLTTLTAASKVVGTPVFDWDRDDFNFNVPVHFNKGFTGSSEMGEVGTWTPTSNIATSPVSTFGNYIRIGNLCILNWYYQATATTTIDKIEIGGLPFEPDTSYRWQSGGGSCSGGTLGLAGHSFSGWNIETGTEDYAIFGRTAAIRPSDETALITKNSNYVGVFSGASFFSSGTIMYKIAEGQ